MADNIKADHIADVHDMVVDNTQSGGDINVTRKDTATGAEADKIKGAQAEHMNNSSQSTPYAQGSAQVELDEILEDFYDGDIRQSDMGKAKQALLDWHNKQVLEIIGEDDTVFLPGFNGRKYDVLVRNKLRAEQRNKLKEVE